MIRFLPPRAAALATVAILLLIGLTAGPRMSLAVAAVAVILAIIAWGALSALRDWRRS